MRGRKVECPILLSDEQSLSTSDPAYEKIPLVVDTKGDTIFRVKHSKTYQTAKGRRAIQEKRAAQKEATKNEVAATKMTKKVRAVDWSLSKGKKRAVESEVEESSSRNVRRHDSVSGDETDGLTSAPARHDVVNGARVVDPSVSKGTKRKAEAEAQASTSGKVARYVSVSDNEAAPAPHDVGDGPSSGTGSAPTVTEAAREELRDKVKKLDKRREKIVKKVGKCKNKIDRAKEKDDQEAILEAKKRLLELQFKLEEVKRELKKLHLDVGRA